MMGRPASKVSKVVVAGPLAPYAEGFEARLEELGYTPLSAVNTMRLMVHLSRWLDARGLTAADLSGVRVEQYFHERRAAGYLGSLSPRSLTVLLELLCSEGVLAAEETPAPCSASEALLVSFQNYLLAERALVSSTALAYVMRARRFLAEGNPEVELAGLTAADVTRAVLAEAGRASVGSTQFFVVALRAFLRFCFVQGLISTDLSAAALTMTGRRRPGLPKSISRADAGALLGSCDRRTATGRRDRAVLLILLRLGLRSSEVATLRLEDLDWRAGELVVHGKAQRTDRLPLPGDVGEAIAAYLHRGRPRTTRREVFLRTLAPIAPLSRRGVSLIVHRACVRAGVTPVGSHRLRHTLACDMVRAEVPLPRISQVLRHRGLVSTAIYARTDIDQLRMLAQPWPSTGATR
jgi:integrase/recombinase XerD